MTELSGAATQIRLLGVPSVVTRGEVVRFDTRKAMAIVALLAVTEREWSREELAAMLWPESVASRARGALRRTLVTATQVGPALETSRTGVRLRPEGLWCDVREFRARVGAPSRVNDGAAVELWQGDFLAGFSLRDSPDFEDWHDAARSELRAQLDAALARLVEHLAAKEQFETALTYARERVALDRLHEPAQRQLMRVLGAAGQRPAAVQQYRRCVEILDAELGVAPLPETTALYEALRRDDLPPSPGEQPRTATTPPQRQLFVGRSDELEQLASSWATVATKPQVVVVVGESGTGKSALVDHFIAVTPISDVTYVRAHESERGRAFGLAADLVAALASDTRAVDSLATADRYRLAALVPSLAPDVIHVPPLNTPGAITRLLGSIRSLIEQSSDRHRLVWIDGLEWADQESIDLVTFLVLRPTRSVMVALCARADGIPDSAASAIADALRQGRGRMLRIGPLSRDDVAEMFESDDQEALDQIMLSTAGNPMLVTESLLALHQETPQAHSLEAVVGARLEAASDTTRQVLSTLAVLGVAADPLLIQHVSGRLESEIADALDEAAARRLVSVRPGRDLYDFPYDGLRLAVLQRTTAARRRLLHARAADVLGQRRRRHLGQVAAVTVAEHLRLAGRDDEAAGMFLVAAAESRQMYAHSTAADHLLTALGLGADPVRAHLALGEARVRLGEYAAAVDSFELAAAHAELPADRVAAEHRLADVHHRMGEWTLALDHLRAAVEWAGDADVSDHLSAIVADTALIHLRLGDLAGADEAARRALRLATSSDNLAAHAQAANVLAVLAARAGDHVAAESWLDVASAGAQELMDLGQVVSVLNNRARLHADRDEVEPAIEVMRNAIAMGEQHGDRHRLGALHANLSDLLYRAGDVEGARHHQLESAQLLAGVDQAPTRRPEIWKLVEW